MVSKAVDSAPKVRKQHGEPAKDGVGTSLNELNQLEKQIKGERIVSIKEKVQRNGENMQHQVSAVMSAISSRDSLQTEKKSPSDKLCARIDHPSYKFRGFSQGRGNRDRINRQVLSAASIKIPCMERLPPYESWIHLARNERMAEDQSVIGRRRIYDDQQASQTLLCSDSEKELTEPEGVKHDFSEGEDRLLLMAFDEHGLTEEVIKIVGQFVGGTTSEIQERYKSLKEKNMGGMDRHFEDSRGYESHTGICLEKSLSAALDSLDNLFCRQCIRFDCPVHGCFQPIIYPRERLPAWSEPESDRKPCSDQCYLSLKVVKISSEDSTPDFLDKKATKMKETDGILAPASAEELGDQGTKGILKQGKCDYVTTKPFTAEIDCCDLNSNLPLSDSMGKRKVTNQSDSALCDSTFPPDDANNYCKKQKKSTINKLTVSGSTCHCEHDKRVGDGQKDATNETEFMHLSNSMEGQVDEMLNFSTWKPLEKDLFLKGVEIFGRNSCLIARNLLSGLKTCMEIASYMHAGEASAFHRSIAASSSTIDGNGKINPECTGQEMPSSSQSSRKRGKTRKLQFSLKSSGLPSTRRRNTDGENQPLKQYTPCGCRGTCGKECPCHDNGNCCEKYCGCSMFCKNRFRGCHCAKGQCRSRQCPCFAAQRECDPDVCRNCWVSCGDGSLGEPPRRGDGQCGNMRSLLGQHKRILLAESDVAGWGAFSKDPVKKDDYIGEYTGELVSHTEADARADSPFLFTLNDQYVIDAHHKGNKLKFANHSSSNGNCAAKMMMVAGNHRVGIFAKRDIEAGEELLYDYGYDPSVAPPWACKPEASKRGESAVSRGRARKNKSH